MPIVLGWTSYRGFFYSNERDEPAHVQVWEGNKEVKIWLHDLTVALNIRLLRMKLAISFVIYESIGESC
jgi:hypothetical protein